MMDTPRSILYDLRVRERERVNSVTTTSVIWRHFGSAVRTERRRLKISLASFAKKLGRTATMVSFMESGKRQWPMAKAEMAVKLLSK